MADFKKLIALITDEVDKFTSGIPGIQEQMQEDISMLTKQLDLNGKNIAVTGKNIKLLSQLKGKLQKIILSPEYKESVKKLLSNFDKIVRLQNEYFSEVEGSFKPPAVQKQITKHAIETVANQLTENGLAANVTDKVYELLRKATTSGTLMKSLNDQLRDFVTNSDSGEGQLSRYTKQIATDSLNQFSGAYTQLISADLGFEWFRYSGANIETTRPFCLACTQRKWFHISEIPKVLKGQFPEFKEFDGTIDPKTKLPRGMIPGTDVSNFQVNRGGYNCGHQWRPGSEDIVPQDIKSAVFATPEYKVWAGKNSVEKTEEKPKQEPEKQKPGPPLKQTPTPATKTETAAAPTKLDRSDIDIDVLKNEDTESFGYLLNQKDYWKNVKETFPDLDPEEIVSIKMYGNTSYRGVNKYLRDNDKPTFPKADYYENFSKLINKGLDKLPDFDGTVYRGSDVSGIAMEKYMAAFTSNKPITEDAFLSTSSEVSGAFDKNTFFVIKSKTGKQIKDVVEDDLESHLLSENEVLFKSGTKFKIENIKPEKVKGGNKTVIVMTEI